MNSMTSAAGGVNVEVNPSTTSITTADLPESKQFDFWRESYCNTIVGIDILPTSEQSFSGEIATTQVKEINFSHISGQGFKCFRTPLWIHQDREDVIFVPVMLRGNSLIIQDGREAELGPGDFTCFDSTRPHVGMVSGNFESLLLHMPRDIWVRKFGSTEQLTARTVRGDTYMGALVSDFLRQVVPGIGTVDPGTADRLAELSLDLVTTALGSLISQQAPNQSSGRLSLLYRAKTLIVENLHDPDISPEKIAQTLKISERYLRDLFHEENTTVSNWIWERRLEKCHRDLLDPLLAGKSLSQIAFNCGFSDLSHFSRRFKAAFFITPSEFRREKLVGKPQ